MRVDEIKSAVAQLSGQDLDKFRAWYNEYEAKVWDNKIEEDIKTGKLGKLANEAIKDFEANRCSEL